MLGLQNGRTVWRHRAVSGQTPSGMLVATLVALVRNRGKFRAQSMGDVHVESLRMSPLAFRTRPADGISRHGQHVPLLVVLAHVWHNAPPARRRTALPRCPRYRGLVTSQHVQS